jgi:hypothetical protein
MAYSQYFAAVALTATIGKVSYGWGKYWWNKRSLKDRYITVAAGEQLEVELVENEDLSEFDTPEKSDSTGDAPILANRHKGRFRSYLVRSAQAKFGCPLRNEANRLVVRKYIYDLCTERGLLARHIVDHLDIATELVFIPSRAQLTAAAIRHTELSALRHGVLRDLAGIAPSVA